MSPATTTANPKPLLYCQQAQHLLGELSNAVCEVVQIQEYRSRFCAVLEGELDVLRFDNLMSVAIHLANERKIQAKSAYLNHLRIHGCSEEAPIAALLDPTIHHWAR